ncbi:SDR family oxidoreductase [Leptolinea tardivitalis]|uniref:SDR family oxidoreductase n=1 Tax=Leptolinea tardivitalis TaxID=229920 RepID=UPI00078239AA|nr:SDR family oxidoreductase [Leptolinea tardivitalis]GAP19960.1 dTDP-4-dehydrorhamnose reductase [Leptolinea tardivitalis]
MNRLLVTGASGLLGINLALRESAHRDVIGVTHSHSLTGVPFNVRQVNLTADGAIARMIEEIRPDVVIHCAAMADIDSCEKQPEQAELVNSVVPGVLADICDKQDIRLVHLSTDAVFDGTRGDYLETDSPHPLSVYAQTKLKGEQAVLDACPDAIVARVNFYGWSLTGKRSLAEFFYNNLSAGHTVNGFTDVEFCPLFVNHLADLLMSLADSYHTGLFHVVSPVSLSKYEFGCRIANAFGFDDHLINPVSVKNGGLVARRSPKLTLNTDKLKDALQIVLPGVEEGIHAFFEQYLTGFPRKLQEYLKRSE